MYSFKLKDDFIYCYKFKRLYFKVSNTVENFSNLLILFNKKSSVKDLIIK